MDKLKTYIATLLGICLAASSIQAQVKKATLKPKTGQMPTKPVQQAAVKPSTIYLTIPDLSGALNGTLANKSPGTQAASNQAKMAETLIEAREQDRKDYIYGKGNARSYQIQYRSAPVKAAYDEFVPALLANYSYAFTNHSFVEIVVHRMGQECIPNGAYTSPGARGKLERQLARVMVNVDILKSGAIQQNSKYFKNSFYDQFLKEVLDSTKASLNQTLTWTTTQNESAGQYAAYYPSYSTTSSSEVTRSSAFLFNRGVDICIAAAREVANNALAGKATGVDAFTRHLQSAAKGDLFKPLRSFKGQASEIEVFAIRQINLQKATQKQGGLRSYWDENWDCPTALTFSISGADKIKNIAVFNP